MFGPGSDIYNRDFIGMFDYEAFSSSAPLEKKKIHPTVSEDMNWMEE